MKKRIPKPDDWRRQGQEKFLRKATLVFRQYNPNSAAWEHDHCEFCGSRFSLMDGDLNAGYSTIDGYHWICTQCYNDFKEEFEWRVIDSNKS